MAKAKDTPARVRAVATLIVGVRTINTGDELPTDDQVVVDHPDQFEPVED